MEDDFVVAKKKFKSRLIVGTGKYKNFTKKRTNAAIITRPAPIPKAIS